MDRAIGGFPAGLFFAVRCLLDQLHQDIHCLGLEPQVNMDLVKAATQQADIQVRPGMSVLANIKTGEQRIISFFLNPLFRAWHSSLKE